MDRGAIDAKPVLRLAAPSTMHYMHVSSFISYGSYACTPILDARCCVRTRAHHCPIRLHGCGDKHPFSGCSPGRLADAWPGWKPLAGRGRSPHVKGQGGVAIFNGTLTSSSLRLLARFFSYFSRSRRPLRNLVLRRQLCGAPMSSSSASVPSFFASPVAALGFGPSIRSSSATSSFGLHLRPLIDYDIHRRLSPPRGGSGLFTTNVLVSVPIALVRGHSRRAPLGLAPQGGFIPSHPCFPPRPPLF